MVFPRLPAERTTNGFQKKAEQTLTLWMPRGHHPQPDEKNETSS